MLPLQRMGAHCSTLQKVFEVKRLAKVDDPLLVSAKIEGRLVYDVMLDTGAQISVVTPKAVPKHCYTGKMQQVTGVLQMPKMYPTAKVKVEVGKVSADVEVLVGDPTSTSILGRDLPFFWRK